jgi:hypothetical protein
MNIGVRRSAFVASAMVMAGLIAGVGRAEAGFLYATDGQNGNPATNLYVIDTATLARVTVGRIGFAVTGLALNPFTGVLYGDTAPRGSNTRQLITINTITGAGTLIGALGVGLDNIAFDRDGTLYGWSGRTSGSSLYRVNPTTGAATRVGVSGITDAGAALAINGSGTMYLAAAGASGALRTVDKTTGAVTTVATLSGAPFGSGSIKSLAFDSSGTLFGINLNEGGPGNPGAPGATAIVTINPTTGVVTSLGAGPPGLTALAFTPSVVPEPSSLTLVAIGGALALACRRLHRGRRCGWVETRCLTQAG